MNATCIRLLFAVLLVAASAWGGAIFDASTLTGSPGDSLSFGGTVENTWGFDLFINGVGLNVAGPVAWVLDPLPFLANSLYPLPDGVTDGPFEWFTLGIPSGTPPGTYDGEFTLQGGADGDAQLLLESVPFHVQVNGAAGAVPEPSSLWLVAGAILVGLGRAKWRSKSS
jgi:hypothetical protein